MLTRYLLSSHLGPNLMPMQVTAPHDGQGIWKTMGLGRAYAKLKNMCVTSVGALVFAFSATM